MLSIIINFINGQNDTEFMRSASYNVIDNLIEEFPEDKNIAIFEKMCRIRNFELNVKDAYDAGLMKMPIYLSMGIESIPAALSVSYIDKNPEIFAQHRAHGYYIAFGGNLEKLIDELLHRPSGCAHGMGGSASIHAPEIRMHGHDGFMGTQVPFGVGRILAQNHKNKNKIYGLCVMGDASAEEGYVLGALGWAPHKNLPMLFICEDNNLSVLTTVDVRRNWKISDVAKSFGMKTIEIADDPWTIAYYTNKLKDELPAFINIYTSRFLWHAGTGRDEIPKAWNWWDRYEITKDKLKKAGLGNKIEEIEGKEKNFIDELWKRKKE